MRLSIHNQGDWRGWRDWRDWRGWRGGNDKARAAAEPRHGGPKLLEGMERMEGLEGVEGNTRKKKAATW